MRKQKKWFIRALLIWSMVLTLLAPSLVYAASKGANTGEKSCAYIQFYNFSDDSYSYLYCSDNLKDNYGYTVEKIKGAAYSAKTNTLTLNNYSHATVMLSANEMGDDFKIKLKGTNKLQQLEVWGYGYGGTLKLTGNGTLIVNKNKNAQNAITLHAEESNAYFKVDESVKLKAYARTNSDFSVCVYGTKKSKNAITFTNNKTLNKKVKKNRDKELTFTQVSYEGQTLDLFLYEKDGKYYGMFYEATGGYYRIFQLSKNGDKYEVEEELEHTSNGTIPSAYNAITVDGKTYSFYIKGSINKK